jgi:hypothetical protein
VKTISNSQKLRRKIDLVLPGLTTAVHKLKSHPQFSNIYPEYLFALHCIIRASVPLMETALQRCYTIADSDAVAEGVATYLSQHIQEEMNHDDWLLNDLEHLGFHRSIILQRPPSPTVASFVGSQYYWILHYHPVALLGYIAILEGYPSTVKQIEDLISKTVYPREAFSTWTKHAQLDPQHRDDLNVALDRLPLKPEDFTVLGISALQTVHLGELVIREIVEIHSS